MHRRYVQPGPGEQQRHDSQLAVAAPAELMSRQQAAEASFPVLAANIRQNIDWAKQVGGDPLDSDLLMLLVIELEKKIGGRRPELPPPPTNSELTLHALPQPRPTRSQARTKKRLGAEIRQAERAQDYGPTDSP